MNELITLYGSPAAMRMYDEDVTELEHALQAAALAIADGAPDHLVAAALLHDVGHLVSDDNVTLDEPLTEDFEHERVGARSLGHRARRPARLGEALPVRGRARVPR
jgi:predicted HD phosphohydrolase